VLDILVFLFQRHVADIMPKIAVSTDVAGLAASVAGLREGFEVQVESTSIGIPGGSAREGVCITAGVAAVGRL
jgi:hypothetical protein